MQPFYSFVKSFLINLTNFLSKPTRFLSLRFAQKRDYEQALPCGQVVFDKLMKYLRQHAPVRFYFCIGFITRPIKMLARVGFAIRCDFTVTGE
jgi:hypothetical protein